MSQRNYREDLYTAFRRQVRARDNRTCQWTDCGVRKHIQVHHILPWKTHPWLRYDVDNGICLCKKHHKIVMGHELAYASFLSSLICLK